MNPIVPRRAGQSRGRPVDLAGWLADLFIPRWIARTCLPGRPGYVEEVAAGDGAPMAGGRCTTLVTARLIYTYSLAYGFDGRPATLEAARHGLRFLRDACHLGAGRYAHDVDRGGQTPGAPADLYDLAFVLLALGGYAQATGDGDILALTTAIGERLDTELFDPEGGYQDPAGGAARRLHFPQMHLFEAFLLLHALVPAGGWDRRAARELALIDRLCSEDRGIDEWYGPHWQPLDPAEPNDRELGHHFEWAWLLYRYAARFGSAQAADIGDRLYRSAIAAAGIRPGALRSLVPNRLDAAGRPIMAPRPLWPTAELLRSTLEARLLGRQTDGAPMIEEAMDLIFERAMDVRTGLWRNIVDENHERVSSTLPVRVLYHLIPHFIAYLEAPPGRVAPAA